MARSLSDLFPDPQTLLELEPEEFAGPLLAYLNDLAEGERSNLNRYNLTLRTNQAYEGFPHAIVPRITEAVVEAWIWLEREGFIAPKPGQQGEWAYITRRGRQVATAEDLNAYRRASILPRGSLHPLIADRVWPSFLRGDYDTAIFQAFREVEIGVRDAGGFSAGDLGTDLMRKAFAVGAGPLTDTSLVRSEQQALSDLFAGSIGWAKNPQSHRNVAISDPRVAAELIGLASYLMRVVDDRRPPGS